MLGLSGLNGLERLVPDRLRRAMWIRPRYPLVAVELREDAVIAARLRRQRAGYQLSGRSTRALPDGVFSTTMMMPKVEDAAALARAVSEALEAAGAEGAAKISLALPDTAARVSLLDFQELPPSRDQIAELLRWRLKKTVPFRLEDAQLSWQELGKAEDGRVQMLVAVAPRDALRAIEKIFEALGIRVGLIDLATFNLLNLLRLDGMWDAAEDQVQSVPRDRALLSATRTYFSLMIVRGTRLIFYRAKNYHVRGGFRGDESLAVVGRELRTTLSYYEEHLLGEGIDTMVAHVSGVPTEGLLETARGAGCPDVRVIEIVNLLPELTSLGQAETMELMPSLGLALRREP